jgi:predicted nucleic acid-binding protein
MTRGAIVVDTSAILAVLLNEPLRPALVGVTRGVTLCVPASVPWEIGNAVVSLVRRRRLTAAQAAAVVGGFTHLPLRHVAVDIARSVAAAAELGIYAYDAYVLEAARIHRCRLLTLDGRLARAASASGIPLVEVTP